MAFSDSGGGWDDDDDLFGNKAHLGPEISRAGVQKSFQNNQIYDGDRLGSQAKSCAFQRFLLDATEKRPNQTNVLLIQGTREQPKYITDNGKKNYECF